MKRAIPLLCYVIGAICCIHTMQPESVKITLVILAYMLILNIREEYRNNSIKYEPSERVKEALNCLYTDFNMLIDGDWNGSAEEAQDSIEMLERIAKELDVELKDNREEEEL